jgi:hypothetical protein
MSTPPEAIETCLQEVERARARVSRLRSKQITKVDDRDYLKSVAYSWFKSHRPVIEAAVPHTSLETVDTRLKDVLGATARSSARSTYLSRLNEAKKALTALRGSSLVPSRVLTSVNDAAPDFTPLAADPAMKSILQRRWTESQTCLRAGAPLAATVMMGGLLEALFVARANIMTNKGALFRAKSTPIDAKTKGPLPLTEWTLRPYIDVAAELGWISRSGKDIAAVLRDYRNYVHPEKERAHGVALDDHDSAMFWDVTKSLARQLLSSAAAAATGS